MSLLDDYNNMKVIVEKLIEDNITLRAENERIKVESNMKIVKPPTANSISELRHEISMLKRQNNELETGNKYVEEYKELLKSKEIDIENLKTN
jgi:regulator of replication initiation timing